MKIQGYVPVNTSKQLLLVITISVNITGLTGNLKGFYRDFLMYCFSPRTSHLQKKALKDSKKWRNKPWYLSKWEKKNAQ